MKLEAKKRTTGTAAALRREGRLPAVVYNRELNLSVSVDTKTFDRVFRSQGQSSIIDLEVDGTEHAVLVKAVQMDKRRRAPQHVDFYAVTEGQEVEVHVPVEFHGTPAGVKEGGMLDVHRREVFIAVMPRLIPNHLELDLSALEIGDSLHISDVASQLPPEATILDETDLTLVTVVPPRLVEEEAEEVEEIATEPEVIGHGGEEGDEDEEDED